MSGAEPLDEFAEAFTRHLRSGHVPSHDEIVEEFPELSEDLRGLVKTLSILEEASFQHRTRGASPMVADASGRRWTRVGGFRLIREIGRGGMGIVYEAEQEALQRRVAIKVLPSNPLRPEAQLTRFKREATAIARLHHSHIVPVFGTGEQNGVHYCVMQYIEGCSLDRLIRALGQQFVIDAGAPRPAVRTQHDETRQKGVTLPKHYWKNVARIGVDMADALSHAHGHGILHRDIKPSNLLIDKSGHVWLADFGVAKLMDQDNLTATDGLIGTLRYTSPEQWEGQSDARSDIYSLGLTLYELCALQPAFAANDRRELIRQVAETTPERLSRLMPGIPADLETVINKAMARSPADRYQAAANLANDLRRFATDRPVTARRISLLERSWRWCRRHRTETALGSVIAMLLIAYGLTASIAYVREARIRRESQYTARTAISAINQVYDAYVPDWTSSSTVSAHGSISVSPATAELLEGLLKFYDELAERPSHISVEKDVFEVTAALRRVALIYHRLGMFAESKDAYAKAIQRLSSLAKQSAAPRSQLEHARVSNELGAVYWTDRQISEAYRSHQNAIEILQRIDDSKSTELHQDVLFEKARTDYLLGRRSRGRQGGVPLRPVITQQQEQFDKDIRRPPLREQSIRNAVNILETLVKDSPSKPEYRHLLALCYCELADVVVDRENSGNATVASAIQLLEQLAKENPRQPAYRYSLCTTLLWLNLTRNAREDTLENAAERAGRAISLAETLAQERPDEWIYSAVQVEAQLLMAQVHSFRALPDDAHASATRAVEVGQELVKKYPDCVSFQYWVGVAHATTGGILSEAGHKDAALSAYDLALKRFAEVLKIESDWGHVVLRDLKTASSARARILASASRNKEAEIALRESVNYAMKLEKTLAAVK